VLISNFLFFAYLNKSISGKLYVKEAPIPSLNSDQLELYTRVCKDLINEAPSPNLIYVEKIYESHDEEIVVHIGYYNTDFVLMYWNGKILRGYTHREMPMLPRCYIFDKSGHFLRKGEAASY
jgi:hypothetical protein